LHLQSLRVAAVALLLSVPLPAIAETAPEILRVTRTGDDLIEGSLRWAIERNNAAPGRFRIEIDPDGSGPHVMRPASLLPAIKGPVRIEGVPWKRSGEFVALDGSGFIQDQGQKTCAGAVPGQFGANVRTTTNPGLAIVDTQGVEIAGLEIRNFCIGVLIHRSGGNVVEDSRIVANRGGAGVMLTGDDGNGGATAATTIHNKVQRNEFLDNGDGLELTRGAAFNLVARNVFRSTSANPEPSQGIEVLLGHDNVIVRNRFEGYSDGIQVNGGNRNTIASNEFHDNALALSMTGEGNVIDGNIITRNGIGVALRPSAGKSVTRVTRNLIHNNSQPISRCWSGGSCDPDLRKGGIIFGVPAQEHATYMGERGGGVAFDPAQLKRICPDEAPNCQAAPNNGIEAPTLDKVTRDGTTLTANGHATLGAQAGAVIELYANPNAGDSEGEIFLGEATAKSDANGRVTFTMTVNAPFGLVPTSFTATLTSSDGATSEFSRPVGLSD
jgi:3-dehydroshikimate dehydratase